MTTDLETAARAALETMKGIRDDDTAIVVETGQRYVGKYARALQPHIAALESALASPGVDTRLDTGKSVDPAAIRRAALEEAVRLARAVADKHWDAEEDLRMAGALDAESAIRALAKKEKGDE
jgi:hypothetical protein